MNTSRTYGGAPASGVTAALSLTGPTSMSVPNAVRAAGEYFAQQSVILSSQRKERLDPWLGSPHQGWREADSNKGSAFEAFLAYFMTLLGDTVTPAVSDSNGTLRPTRAYDFLSEMLRRTEGKLRCAAAGQVSWGSLHLEEFDSALLGAVTPTNLYLYLVPSEEIVRAYNLKGDGLAVPKVYRSHHCKYRGKCEIPNCPAITDYSIRASVVEREGLYLLNAPAWLKKHGGDPVQFAEVLEKRYPQLQS